MRNKLTRLITWGKKGTRTSLKEMQEVRVVLSRRQLLLLMLGVAVCTFAGLWASGQEYTATAVVFLATAGVGVVMLWLAQVTYRRYEHGCDNQGRELRLISRNTALAALMKRRLRSGEMVCINHRLYYRSHGRKRQRTPWPRLWIVELKDFPKLAVNEKRAVPAHVMWPGPFRGGIFWRSSDVYVDIERNGTRSYSFRADGLPKQQWLRLRSVSAQQLEDLANELELIIRDIERVGHNHRVGNRNRFELGG